MFSLKANAKCDQLPLPEEAYLTLGGSSTCRRPNFLWQKEVNSVEVLMKQEPRKQPLFWGAASQPVYQRRGQRRSVEKGWWKWCTCPWKYHHFIKKTTQIVLCWSNLSAKFWYVDIDVTQPVMTCVFLPVHQSLLGWIPAPPWPWLGISG